MYFCLEVVPLLQLLQFSSCVEGFKQDFDLLLWTCVLLQFVEHLGGQAQLLNRKACLAISVPLHPMIVQLGVGQSSSFTPNKMPVLALLTVAYSCWNRKGLLPNLPQLEV